jgi:hypothetical protein
MNIKELYEMLELIEKDVGFFALSSYDVMRKIKNTLFVHFDETKNA